MKLPVEAEMLRIFILESDKFQNKPLYEAIVDAALENGMSGATVLRGILGFDAHARVHTTKILRLAEYLPLVIEIVDSSEKIEKFLPVIDFMIDEGLVTLEKVKILKYSHTE